MNRAIKEFIINDLRELQAYQVSDDGTEHTVRCPYCGDSKDITHAHLGIYIDPNEDTAMLWHCFRCGAGGAVTDEFLDDIGVRLGEDEMSQLRNYNKKLAKLNKRGIIRTERFIVPVCEPGFLNDQKLAYINRRLGTDMDYNEAKQNKIVPSLMAFMMANELTKIDNVPNWIPKVLERDYVGFLSSNNNLLTFRNIRPDGKGKRYYKLFINPLNPDNATFYSIPSQLDLMYQEGVDIHIAEGTFDILGVKYNVDPPSEHRIMYASCGYSYMSILKHLARNGIVTHINLHVYADADKSDYEHLKMINKNPVSAFIEHLYLHRNGYEGEKDYGVPKERIIDRARQIW